MVLDLMAHRKHNWPGVLMDGSKPSWSRLAASFLILMPVAWVSFIVFKTATMPGADQLLAIGGIITTGVGVYTANKITTPAIIRAEKQRDPG